MRRYKLTELGKTLQFCFEQDTIQFVFNNNLDLKDKDNVERIKLLMGNVPEINIKIFSIIEYFKTYQGIKIVDIIIEKNNNTNVYFTSAVSLDYAKDKTKYYYLKDILDERYFTALY